jgi:DNA polymerase (family 10)
MSRRIVGAVRVQKRSLSNADIAAALDELADLSELDGAVVYRVVAYRQAASSVRQSPIGVEQLAAQGRLTTLRGVGKTIAEKIETLIETGEIPAAEKLKQKFPTSLVELMRLRGLGPKTALKIHQSLGVASLDELRRAAEEGRLRSVRGLGSKVEQNVLEALAQPGTGKRSARPTGERRLLSDVLPLAEQVVEALRAHPAADKVELAGSARRKTDTCKDIDIIATAHDPAALSRALTSLDVTAETRASGSAGARVVSHNGVAIELRVVAPDQFGSLLQHLTGSKQHNVALREHAVKRGLHVSEYGIEEDVTELQHRCATEHEVYDRLGLDYIEPELREGRGELEAALEHRLPELVNERDIRGDLHCHTTASDGRDSIERMAAAARARSYSYLAITDHSASFGFGHDVQPEQLLEQVERVRELNRGMRGFRLLMGTEVNINPDGSLDYDDDVLARLDWVNASVHSSFRMGEKAMTERVLAAMENPFVDAIGHPTGRLLLRREPYALDIERVVERAAETGTMLEINSNPDRRDLSDLHARLAAEARVMIVVSSDAHGADTLDMMRFGVATARRAWLSAEQVANAHGLQELRKLRKRNRTAR